MNNFQVSHASLFWKESAGDNKTQTKQNNIEKSNA